MHRLRVSAFCILAACAVAQAAALLPVRAAAEEPIQFVFTSDAHYGLARATFRGASNVSAHVVNMALVAKINALPQVRFPDDGGLRAGAPIGGLDFIVEGGDTTNRGDGVGAAAIQSAAVSWSQFAADYFDGLAVNDRDGRPARLFVVPGNHEASNAVGFYKPMTPPIDKTSMVEIYNRMLSPAAPKTASTFDYARDRVLHAKDVRGLHLEFQQVWPDSTGRAWMERDLSAVSSSTPVVIFVHDQPDGDARHFINPNPPHDINAADQFENLLADIFEDGRTIAAQSLAEQTALEAFLRKHRNIAAYFHGHSNWNEFYEWTGPSHSVGLHVFRADSPMKGRLSAADETALSFHVATVDPSTWRMTVRECFWNRGPGITWGSASTVALGAPASSRD